jgi:hypothetical protein
MMWMKLSPTTLVTKQFLEKDLSIIQSDSRCSLEPFATLNLKGMRKSWVSNFSVSQSFPFAIHPLAHVQELAERFVGVRRA